MPHKRPAVWCWHLARQSGKPAPAHGPFCIFVDSERMWDWIPSTFPSPLAPGGRYRLTLRWAVRYKGSRHSTEYQTTKTVRSGMFLSGADLSAVDSCLPLYRLHRGFANGTGSELLSYSSSYRERSTACSVTVGVELARSTGREITTKFQFTQPMGLLLINFFARCRAFQTGTTYNAALVNNTHTLVDVRRTHQKRFSDSTQNDVAAG